MLSGIVVTIALTRTSDRIGLLYGADLLGAAAGCLAIVWVLELTDITSTALIDGRHRGDRRLVLRALQGARGRGPLVADGGAIRAAPRSTPKPSIRSA